METDVRQGYYTWQEVCEDPRLRDLPFKIELNAYGQIVMSPVRVKHGAYQTEISFLLRQALANGQTGVETAIQTGEGTRVADVTWFSPARWRLAEDAFDAPIAPEICVEVLSPGNTSAEMAEKRRLYVEAGAEEVWLCGIDGRMQFFTALGEGAASPRAPTFPNRIVL
ncbi:MAG: Uma2 family endonuclease [Bacteroidota bacterium]